MEAIDRQHQQDRVIRDDDPKIDRVSHGHLRTVGGVIVLSALIAFAPAAPLAVYVGATGAWLLLLGTRTRYILVVALALRIIASLGAPQLSTDVYRYLWDGIVTTSGVNPYRHAPIDTALAALRPEWFDRINHPEIATIYPPYAQLLFAVAGGSLLMWRGLLVAFDLWTIAMLQRRDPRIAFAYATSPLILFEGFWSAHIEIAAVAFLIAAFVLGHPEERPESERGESKGSLFRMTDFAPLTFAISSGIKLTPLAALPAMLRDARRRVAFAAIFAIAFLGPILLAAGIMPGLTEYATRWSFNSPAFLLAKTAVAQIPMKDFWTAIKDPLHLEPVADTVYRHLYPDFLARVVLASLLVIVLAVILSRVRETTAAIADSLGALLVLSPTIHPWYWIVVFPVALLGRRHLWIWLAVASPFSYLLYESADNQTIVLLLCYALPLAGWLMTRSRRGVARP